MSKHKLPTDSNPLAKVIGKKLLFVIKDRGVEWADAARQCGLGTNRFHYILQGAQVPDEREAQRIAGWLFEGKDYTEDPIPKTPAQVRKGRTFKAVRGEIPNKLHDRMMKAAARLGLTQTGMIHLALERLLDNEPVMHTFKMAGDKLSQARVNDYMDAAPSLKLILEGDVELAVAMGAQLVKAREEPKPMQTHQVLGVSIGEDNWEVIE